MEQLSSIENFEQRFEKVKKIWVILEQKGFKMTNLELIKRELEQKRPVPLVHDEV